MEQGFEMDFFITYIRDERRMSPASVYNYKLDLNSFFTWIEKRLGEGFDVAEITEEHCSNYITYLSKSGKGETTLNRHMSALRKFFLYMKKKKRITSLPTAELENVKPPKRIPKPVPSDDIMKLIESAPTRVRVMLEIMWGAGLRRAELVSLRTASFDFTKKTVRALGKGNKERIVPINDFIIATVQMYLQTLPKGTTWLFPSDKVKGYHLSVRRVNELIDEACERAGVEKTTPHKFRASFATDLLEGGADIRIIQEMMGHANMSTTQLYLSATNVRAQKAYNQAHPRAKMVVEQALLEIATGME